MTDYDPREAHAIEANYEIAIIDTILGDDRDSPDHTLLLTHSIVGLPNMRFAVTLVYADHARFYVVHDDYDLEITEVTEVARTTY